MFFSLINFDPVLILYRIESWLQVSLSALKFETHTPTVFFKVWFLLSFVFSKKKKNVVTDWLVIVHLFDISFYKRGRVI